jgi:hypothetical protein
MSYQCSAAVNDVSVNNRCTKPSVRFIILNIGAIKSITLCEEHIGAHAVNSFERFGWMEITEEEFKVGELLND